MADLTKDELKAIFKAGAIPTEAQFASLIESQINKKDTGSLILSASSIDISGSAIAKTDIDLLKQGKSISSPTITSGSTSAEDNINYTQYLRPEAVISDSDTSTYTKYTTPGRMGTFISGTLFFDLNKSSSNNYIALGATNTQLRLTGNITSSGNISASGTIIANSIIGTSTTFTNITASGAISASGNLIVGGTSALNGDITVPKTVKLYFDGPSGLHVYSEGTATDENQVILAKTNNLRILNQAHGKDIIFGTENASGTAKTPLTLSGSGDALFGGNVLANGFQYVTSPNILTLHSTLSSTPQLHLRCDENGAVGPKIILEHSSSSPAANDVISTIGFTGRDSAGNSTTYAQIHSTIVDPATGSEGGKLSLAVASHNGTVINGIVIEDGGASNTTDVTVGSGATSNIIIPGNVSASGNLISNNITASGAISASRIDTTGTLDLNAGDNITLDAADDIVLTTTSADGEIQIVSAHTAGRALFIDANAAVTSEVDIDAGTLDIDSAGNTTIDAGGSIGLTAATTASITSTLNAGASILLHANGGTSETIKIHSDQGTSTTEGAASVQLLSDAGGIGIKSTTNTAGAIRITADGGTNETILIHADQGTDASSINIASDVGGIMLSAIKGVKSKITNGTLAGGGIDAATTEIQVGKYNGEIVTTIFIDIGAGSIVSSADAGDVIGEDGVANAYVTQITAAKNGIVYKGEIVCLEVPTTGDPDINVAANSSGTIAEDAGGEGQHVLANCGTQTLALKTDFTIPAGGIQDDFIYLTHGGTTAGTYNAGKFYIRFYGVSPLGL